MARKTTKRGKKDPTDFSYLLVKPTEEVATEEDINDGEKENEK